MQSSQLIRRARHRAHLTQRELAARAETSHATLAAYETGAKIPLLPGTDNSAVLTVERPGYVGRTIELMRADAKNHVLRISLTREP